ncbi:MAG: DUF4244 domain-containing protein [Actinomycetaceae bacterium]|nr:DUF4244 domain-containing protein [Actinomycetaceae bacterium]
MLFLDKVRAGFVHLLLKVAGVRSAAEREEDGYVTAEYAVGIIAAVAFAGLLLAVIKSGSVQSMLTSIIETALRV